MRRFHVGLALGWVVACALGCTATSNESKRTETWPQPPAQSGLAQVRPGMSQQAVMELLGPPSQITNTSRLAGPQETPGGGARTYYLYDGIGEVVFSSAAGGATAALGVYPESSAGRTAP